MDMTHHQFERKTRYRSMSTTSLPAKFSVEVSKIYYILSDYSTNFTVLEIYVKTGFEDLLYI